MSSRHLELLEELHLAHAEAALLSKKMSDLQVASRAHHDELHSIMQQWQVASSRTVQLHNELRGVIEAGRDKDSDTSFKILAIPE